jgi:membrane dipeptidase
VSYSFAFISCCHADESYIIRQPVIDGHIDLPELARSVFSNNIDRFNLDKPTVSRLHSSGTRSILTRIGMPGGTFRHTTSSCRPSWRLLLVDVSECRHLISSRCSRTRCYSRYVDCKKDGPEFLTPTNRVRDTLEQIDVAKLMIERYSDSFAYCETAADVREAIKDGKIASLLGIEGCVRKSVLSKRHPDDQPCFVLFSTTKQTNDHAELISWGTRSQASHVSVRNSFY